MNYSDKNVLMLSKYDYKIYFISKMEKPVKRMENHRIFKKDTFFKKMIFGFKSRNYPPIIKELKNFSIKC